MNIANTCMSHVFFIPLQLDQFYSGRCIENCISQIKFFYWVGKKRRMLINFGTLDKYIEC